MSDNFSFNDVDGFEKAFQAYVEAKISELNGINWDSINDIEKKSPAINDLKRLGLFLETTQKNFSKIIETEEGNYNKRFLEREEKLRKIRTISAPKSSGIRILKNESREKTYADAASKETNGNKKKAVVKKESTSALVPFAPQLLNLEQFEALARKMELAPNVHKQAIPIEQPSECLKFPGYTCWSSIEGRFCYCLDGIVRFFHTTRFHGKDEQVYKFSIDRRCLTEGVGKSTVDPNSSIYWVPSKYNPDSKDRQCYSYHMKFIPASKPLAPKEHFNVRLCDNRTLAVDLKLINDVDLDIVIEHGEATQGILAAAIEERYRRKYISTK